MLVFVIYHYLSLCKNVKHAKKFRGLALFKALSLQEFLSHLRITNSREREHSIITLSNAQVTKCPRFTSASPFFALVQFW